MTRLAHAQQRPGGEELRIYASDLDAPNQLSDPLLRPTPASVGPSTISRWFRDEFGTSPTA
ncbi:hypothetical protein [Streptomyces sp. NPDC058773]|uniref:hypothetical protein n=1 Tax=Streptomyces sp. NPDC058773 TaxID=3346632 RepID=UPI0036CA5C9D